MKRMMLVTAIFMSGCAAHRTTHAHWDGHVWSCPPTKDTWVDEAKAFSPERNHNFVYCVPPTAAERKGLR